MACERGCQGTPICNALDLCCIQFLQDCGKECNGVADGYSTIQFDAEGNLVVCSNVGGICTCSGMLTCDALQVFDTDCIGLEKTIVNGECGLEANLLIDPDDCNALECRQNGAFAPTVHIVSASVDSADFVAFLPPAIPASPGALNNNLPMQLIVQNPTDCCDMDIQVGFSGYMTFVGNQSGDHFIHVDGNVNFEIDAVPVINPASHNTSHVSRMSPGVDPLFEQNYDLRTNGYSGIVTIPAGGNVTFDSWLDLDIRQNIGNGGVNPGGIDEMYVQQGRIFAYGICVAT